MNPEFHWNRDSLIRALKAAGVENGNIVFVQSSIGMLGRLEAATCTEDLSAVGLSALLEVVGPNGTVFTPTYSYSFCNKNEFCIQTTPSTVGPFAEFTRNHVGAIRSKDPIFSVVGIGPATESFIANLPKDCFGADSIYGRLTKNRAKIITIGVGLAFSSFRHYVEQKHGVPFRYMKEFSGIIRDGNNISTETWAYFVRALGDFSMPEAWSLEEQARSKGVARVEKCGRGDVWVADANALSNFFENALVEDPWATARGPVVDIEQVERLRMGVPEINIEISPDSSPVEAVRAIAHLPHGLVSPSGNAAMVAIAKYFKLELYRLPTGQLIGGFIIPESHYINDAGIEVTGYAHLPLAFAKGNGGSDGPVFLAYPGDNNDGATLGALAAAFTLVNTLKDRHRDDNWTVVIAPGPGLEVVIENLFPGNLFRLGKTSSRQSSDNEIDPGFVNELVENAMSRLNFK